MYYTKPFGIQSEAYLRFDMNGSSLLLHVEVLGLKRPPYHNLVYKNHGINRLFKSTQAGGENEK